MIRYELGELATLLIGILALLIGRTVRQSVPVLRKIDMPNAVIGAMIIAIAVLIGQLMFHAEVVFGSRTRDALLLIFFTSIGLSAKFSALIKGGKPLLILCVVTVLALVAQNASGTIFRPRLGHASRLRRPGGIAVLCRGTWHGDGLGKGT